MTEQQSKTEKLAKDVLRLCRNTLVVNLRFLDVALSQFQYVSTSGITIGTDGRHLWYDPRCVLSRYKNDQSTVVRDYLHIVFHCIFRHMFISNNVNEACWNLACDIAVENTISELAIKATESPRACAQEQLINNMKKDVKTFTAEKIYAYLMSFHFSDDKLNEMNRNFHADDHSVWFSSEKQPPKSNSAQSSDDGEPNDQNGGGQNETQNGMASASLSSSLEQEWKDISERIGQDLETFSKDQGDKAGGLMQELKAVNREKYDYSSFLRRFSVMGEVMKINDDEFDYVFYTYGLQLYKNVPLIEPLEYKDVKRIKELIIAIDTSGSTSISLVQKFITKTYNILKQQESFFSRFNLHIIQCDAEVQEDAKITTQQEFDEYLQKMKLLGMGGTDFRPVFSYVEKLKKQHEFSNLKGLIYFTDGRGVYPEKKPTYETAFVFIDDDYNDIDVPPWAIKLILTRDEV